MRLFSRESDHYLDLELKRLLKNALGNHRPPAGSRARLLEDAAKLSLEVYPEVGILNRLNLLVRTLQHRRWMTGDYEFGQDIKHSYLAGMAHISVA